jgi:hypothetical protein
MKETTMTSALLAPTTTGRDLDLGISGRRAAQAAAGLTVGGVVTLAMFFAAGQPWGSINDATSIGLALTTVPIAVGLARRNPHAPVLVFGTALDLIGVGVTVVFTSLLIAGRMTFEGSLPFILTGQALIGAWMLGAGVVGWSAPGSRRLAAFGIVGGAGLVATVSGFGIGGMYNPLTLAGFVASLIGTFGFYALLGRRPAR